MLALNVQKWHRLPEMLCGYRSVTGMETGASLQDRYISANMCQYTI